ncbi:hypothetical protein [Streptomyces milbemycinicus]|uniref:hypothetical protein n=1 Tax=Streptomyces milbemycinicus TaxID=476552 RepID=UPI0033CDEAD3
MTRNDRSEERYENVPTAVVYDTFAEMASQLTGRYLHLSESASSEEERDRWWEKVLQLRDEKRAVSSHDRDQLISHIDQWAAELKKLGTAGHG